MKVVRKFALSPVKSRLFNGEFGYRHYAHVYAVQPVGGGNIKFGQALNPKTRFSSLQVGSPVKLELLGHSFLPVEVECRIHIHLAEDRSHGEWFLPTTEVRIIAELLTSQRNMDLVKRVQLFEILPKSIADDLNRRTQTGELTEHEIGPQYRTSYKAV